MILFCHDIRENIKAKESDHNLPDYTENYALNKEITRNEVMAVILKAKWGKSPGVDNLPYEVYKNECMVDCILNLFQLCFSTGKIPNEWSKAIIQPLPKAKENDPRVPLHYRGISLLCCSAKLYSSLLNHRLSTYLDDILVDAQNGFRKKRSCADHVFALNSIIKNRMEENLDTFTAFIDLKKALI